MNAKRVVLLAAALLASFSTQPLGGAERPAPDGLPYLEHLAPVTYRQWRQSKDGRVSVCLATERTTFAAADGITLRCAVRNDSDKPLTVLLPFGDPYFAQSAGLVILGPDGVVGYAGPQKTYVLGTGAFVELPPKSVVEGSLAIPNDNFPGIRKPGLYVIDYRYLSDGYRKQPPPANFWAAQIDSNPVTVLVK